MIFEQGAQRTEKTVLDNILVEPTSKTYDIVGEEEAEATPAEPPETMGAGPFEVSADKTAQVENEQQKKRGRPPK